MPIPDPTEEDINRILDEMNASGEIDYLNIPGIVDILKIYLKNKIIEHWKEENRVMFSYCEDCGAIQFRKDSDGIKCKYCESVSTDFVSALQDDEDVYIPDDFEEEFDLKNWAKKHEMFMKKNKLRVI